MFKHMVTQEVAYESLPFALRAILHRRIAGYIERSEADDLDRVVPLLEHHYWRGDDEAKKREYLTQGGSCGAGVVREQRGHRLLRSPDPAARRRRNGWPRPLRSHRSCTSSAKRSAPFASLPTPARSRSPSMTRSSSRGATTRWRESARRLGRFDDARTLLEAARTALRGPRRRGRSRGRAPGDRHGQRPARRRGHGPRPLPGEPRDPRAPGRRSRASPH